MDRYRLRVGVFVLIVLLLSVIDTVLTCKIVSHGGTELNPVMAFYLQFGPLPFLVVKYFLTAIGLVVLVVHKNYHPFGGSLRVKQILILVLLVYVALILWEGHLVWQTRQHLQVSRKCHRLEACATLSSNRGTGILPVLSFQVAGYWAKT